MVKICDLCTDFVDFADMALPPRDQRAQFGEVVVDLDTVGALQFQLGGVRHCMSSRQFIFALGLHTAEEMETAGFGLYWAESGYWDAPEVDEGAPADLAPMQAPQPPHAALRTMPSRIARLEEEVDEL
ncbi:hypothetical protein Tco_1275484 [Tanacetum coccineum]